MRRRPATFARPALPLAAALAVLSLAACSETPPATAGPDDAPAVAETGSEATELRDAIKAPIDQAKAAEAQVEQAAAAQAAAIEAAENGTAPPEGG